MATGTLIAESLRSGATLDGLRLRVTEISRVAPGDVSAEQRAESFVVFAGRVFRYARDDGRGRAVAETYARAHGVPDSQIDWP